MKRFFPLIFLILALTTCAFAQDKTDKPEPKLLTPAQTQQLIETDKAYVQAQTELELAKQRLITLQAENKALILTFFIDLGLDGKKYATKLEIIDPKTDKVGFLPIPEPPKEDKPAEKKN